MKLRSWMVCAALAVCSLMPLPAFAQTGMVTVSASNLVDSTGTAITNATISFVPENNLGQPISYRIDGKGQAVSSAVTAQVTTGAFTISLADTSLTEPVNVCYSVTVIANTSGDSLLGAGYSCVQPAYANSWCTAGACDFDNYTPSGTAGALVVAPTFSIGTVSTGAAGSSASASVSGSAPNYQLNLSLPTGAAGIGSPSALAALYTRLPINQNLFNPATVTDGYLISATTGALVAEAGYYVSDYIPCSGTMSSSNALFSGSSAFGLAYYDQNYTFISGAAGSTVAAGGTFSCPSTAMYVRLSLDALGNAATVAAYLASEMVVPGSTLPSSYVPYVTPAVSTAQNAAMQALIQSILPDNYNYFDPSRATTGYLYESSSGGTLESISNFGLSDYIPVLAGEVFSVYKGTSATISSGFQQLTYFDINKNYVSGVTGTSTLTPTATSPVTGYVRIPYATNNGVIPQMVVVKGSTVPTGYVPFGGQVNPQALQALYQQDIGFIGDSITSIVGSEWIPTVLSRTGATEVFTDARGGRPWAGAFECYGVASTDPGGTLSTYNASDTNCNAQTNNIGDVAGNTLAENLANVKLLVVELGTDDDTTTIGTLGDAPTAGTLYGDMNWVISTLQTANPTMRIIMVTPYYNIQGSASVVQNIVNAEVSYGASMGIPVLNLLANGGFNSINYVTYLGSSGLHVNAAGGAVMGAAVAQFVERWY